MVYSRGDDETVVREQRGERAMLTNSKESISTTVSTAGPARPRSQATSDEALMERIAKGSRLNSGRPNPHEVFVSYRRLDDEPPPDCSNGDSGGFVRYLLRQVSYDLSTMGIPDAILWQDRVSIQQGD